MTDLQTYFLDAHDGRIVHQEGNVFEQDASVGVGVGIQGQRKKLSTSGAGGQYQAYDRLRPAETVTLDMRHDVERADFLIEEPEGVWLPSDVASDADNDWDDTAVVDAHAYAGFTYDYLALEQGWNGVDDRNGRLMSMVNIGLDYSNAFFISPPFGPEGTGQVGRAFFRAMTDLMPNYANVPMTAAVIRQSAVDLFGAGETYRAIDEALRAVGLPPPGARYGARRGSGGR